MLQHLPPEHVEVEIKRADELDKRCGLTSELDEMWSYVGKKAEPRWLWHAIDHASGTVLDTGMECGGVATNANRRVYGIRPKSGHIVSSYYNR